MPVTEEQEWGGDEPVPVMGWPPDDVPQMEIDPTEPDEGPAPTWEPIPGYTPTDDPPPIAPSPEVDRLHVEQEPGFDDRCKQPFEGLLFLGKLQRAFTFAGHRFVMKTIDGDTLLEIGLLHKPYRDTIADIKAYQMLMVAGALVSVDGRDLPKPNIVGDGDSALPERMTIVKRYFPGTIDLAYEQYLLLEAHVREVMAALGEASG